MLLNDDCLDRLSTSPNNRDGLSISFTESGLYKCVASGQCKLFVGENESQVVEISPRQGVALVCGEIEIDLVIDAQLQIVDPLVGTTIAGHKIIERLGSGGVGIVYRALQIDLQRQVALKVLNSKSVERGDAAVEAFKREAIAAGRMSHPNLVQVYSVGEENGVHFFSMEVVDGGDAELHLKDFGNFSEERAVDIVCQVAEALQYAAAHGLVHRDIKPENLMFTADGLVKLADLGMSSTRELVSDNEVGGTPHFMPPEAVSDPELVDQRSDFYSLGATLFRLLTADLPFGGGTVREILMQHRDADTPLLSDYVDACSNETQLLVEWLMEKQQDDRPQTADEIIEFCNSILAPPRRSPLLLISAAVLAVGATGSAIYFRNQPKETKVVEKIIVDDSATAQAAELQKENERLRSNNAQQRADQVQSKTEPEVKPEVDAQKQAAEELFSQLSLRAAELVSASQLTDAIQLVSSSQLDVARQQSIIDYCYNLFDSYIVDLENNFPELLAANGFEDAQSKLDNLSGMLEDGRVYPKEWNKNLDALQLQLHNAVAAYSNKLSLEKRTLFRTTFYQQVFLPTNTFDLQEASLGIDSELLKIAPIELLSHLQSSKTLLRRAADAQQSLFSALRLDKSSITDPITGKKRTEVNNITADGINIRLLVRGKKTPEHRKWTVFFEPTNWQQLLIDLDINLSNNPEFQALSVSIAVAQVAEQLRNSAVYSDDDFKELLQLQSQWIQLFSSIELDPSLSNEFLALKRSVGIVEQLILGNDYSALQLLDLFLSEYSLIAAWSSLGSVAFNSNE